MKFSDREDIEAPIETVFAAVMDFEGFERAALRRGAQVQREDPPGGPGAGTRWTVKFVFRGKRREVLATMTDFEPPSGLVVSFTSGGIEGLTTIDLVQLSPGRTRVSVAVTLKPGTLSARLMIQSLKLAKSNLDRRFKARVADWASEIERRERLRA
ncbi:SRPBCC family protein [Histidinibacterium aquaticum]|uniref:SRPBCC family protein n=1 Tax=Histidinibacterium aquaticum TaxID=2613962 RepID=A0A5J5GBI3_9RHOB|nr:SRPBCC family protein [Histidinibacterium aquaticum]KAA9005263.1 SRPBCC family protein [Histidinibacterium aquaticum]